MDDSCLSVYLSRTVLKKGYGEVVFRLIQLSFLQKKVFDISNNEKLLFENHAIIMYNPFFQEKKKE